VYLGQPIYLTAATYDREHHLITGIPITWSASDTTVAAIYPNGIGVTIEGRAVGQMVITARAQGTSASADLTVQLIPVASVRVTPDSTATYVGMKYQLTAVTLDQYGTPLSGRVIHWSSSDPLKATVDAAGQVTTLGEGPVAITAASEGKADTASVLGLPRPSADWSAVTTEWSTYQGDPSHTGYVPATLDPVAFAHRWTAPLSQGTPLHPVTAGGGRVYASTNSYFGVQRLYVVDESTGAIRWSHNFGPIHAVNPPAYGDGSVYVSTGGHSDSFLWAFDADAGTTRFSAPYANQWSHWYAPVVIGERVYMAGGEYGGMYAFSTVDGGQLWFTSLNFYEQFTPAVHAGLVYAYTGLSNPGVTVADAATGTVVYGIPDSTFRSGGYTMDLAPVLGASNNLLATQGGRLLCFDLQARRIAWVISEEFIGQVTLANGVIYVRNGQRLEARRESDGSFLWAAGLTGAPFGPMIATRNLLLVSQGARTAAVDLSARLETWSYPAGGGLALTQNGLLLIAQGDGSLTAITMK